MKSLLTLIALLFSFTLNLAAQTATKSDELLLADPFILADGGMYYIYGTNSDDGIRVYKSRDLKNWEGPCGATQGFALHENDSWGDRWFWAPEVYKIGDKYVMTYSVQEHIAYAEASSPVGPFVQTPQKPYLEEKGIDSHIFIDDNTPYMFWVRFFNGNVIHVAPMSEDLKTVKLEQVQKIIESTKGTWEYTTAEPSANVAEGPMVIKHKGLYYLTYSCNHYKSQDYAVGYAVAESPMGPWTRYEGNPILKSHGGYVGTGHHALFQTEKGDTYIVFHAHYDKNNIAPRRTLIAPVRFRKSKTGGADILEISDKIIAPKLKTQSLKAK